MLNNTMSTNPIAGVNLGGWLVLEKWITPSLFRGTNAVDEYTFCEQASASDLQRLKTFRDTFITKADFEWLAKHGIQAVRLPVGYWMFGAAPFQPTVQYVDKAFAWAQATGIKIMLDMHGAPGSQNGRDHSGRQSVVHWHRYPDNITQTLDGIEQLAKRYGKHPAILGFSLLNEPSSFIAKTTLLKYYKQAYDIIRKACGDKPWIVYDDCYLPSRWRRELSGGTFKNVYIDSHQYRVFGVHDKLSPPIVTLLRVRWLTALSLRLMRRHHPVIVGEWSLALAHKTKQPVRRRYAALQLNVYNRNAAWFFWTYKTEASGAWNFRSSVERGDIQLQ